MKTTITITLCACLLASPLAAQTNTPAQPQQVEKCQAVEIVTGISLAFLVWVLYKCCQAAFGPPANTPHPPTPPPPPPKQTNAPPVLPTNNPPELVITNSITDEVCWPSTNGTDWEGNPWLMEFSSTITNSGSHFQQSTNLATWQDCNFQLWAAISASNCCYIVYDSGIPVLTNWCRLDETPFNVLPMNQPTMFYRKATP